MKRGCQVRIQSIQSMSLPVGNEGIQTEVAKDANGGGSNQEPEPEGHANKHPGVNK